ncbi:MAG TPA: hypothetical protein VF092_15425 [Longimicrobium sp.]
MKKLKLESLDVTSFETAPAAVARGTVDANSGIHPGGPVVLETYDIEACGDTRYFDCTFGCSVNTNCPNGCIEL